MEGVRRGMKKKLNAYLLEKLFSRRVTFRIDTLNIRLELQIDSLLTYHYAFREVLDDEIFSVLNDGVLAVFKVVSSEHCACS